jgi:hypothetical protein
MATLILLSPHSGGLDYDLDDLDSNYPSKNDKALFLHSWPSKLFGETWTAQKQGLPIVNTFH